MERRESIGNTAFAFLAGCLIWATTGFANEVPLERELKRLGELSGGVMGVAAIHLESGRAAFLNPDEPFPMASTYKVPIAVTLLHRVDQGELSLEKMVEVLRHDYAPGSGILTELINDPGLALSIRNLLELMLLISDNTSTDLCLREAGGGEAVTARVRTLGIEGLRVDRETLYVISDWMGLDPVPGEAERDPAKYDELLDSVPQEKADAAEKAFYEDPRDSATPRAMAALLEKVWKREALTAESTDLLLDIMKRCQTGAGRLKGLLPAGTVVAHKTGTIGKTLNDVGIVTLPEGAGHVIVAAFVKKSDRSDAERERAIAEVARAAHDYFLFTSKEK